MIMESLSNARTSDGAGTASAAIAFTHNTESPVGVHPCVTQPHFARLITYAHSLPPVTGVIGARYPF